MNIRTAIRTTTIRILGWVLCPLAERVPAATVFCAGVEYGRSVAELDPSRCAVGYNR